MILQKKFNVYEKINSLNTIAKLVKLAHFS